MKNNKKIVFFIDHKHRDLISTAKIGFLLKQKNTFLKAVQSVCSEIQILIRYQKTQTSK